jgi:hypothetical protein
MLKSSEIAALRSEERVLVGTPVTSHDHVEPKHWRHLNVFNKEWVIVCALLAGVPWRRR